MHGRNRAVLLIEVAALVVGSSGVVVAAVGEQAPSPAVRLVRVGLQGAGARILATQAPGVVANSARQMKLAADNGATKEEKKSPQQRSDDLRAKIERILHPEAALEAIAEREKKIAAQKELVEQLVEQKERALTAAKKGGEQALRAPEELIQLQNRVGEQELSLERLEREQAEAKAEVEARQAPPEAARAPEPEISGPSTFDEEMEAQKERAFQNYESEKASGNLRELLDSVR